MNDGEGTTLEGAQDALNRMRRAYERGTGCHLSPAMIQSLGLTVIAQMWEEEDPRDEAPPLTCQEAHDLLSTTRYWPCGEPAVASIYSHRDRRAYNMCEPHAWHAVNRRNMVEQGPATPDNPAIDWDA